MSFSITNWIAAAFIPASSKILSPKRPSFCRCYWRVHVPRHREFYLFLLADFLSQNSLFIFEQLNVFSKIQFSISLALSHFSVIVQRFGRYFSFTKPVILSSPSFTDLEDLVPFQLKASHLHLPLGEKPKVANLMAASLVW